MSDRPAGGAASVTVVVPMYNAAGTVTRTIESVLAQTTPPQRILVVDDASTDASREVVRGLGDAVELVLLDNNSGAGVARNTGARRASTEWLAFIDADDVWAPTFLAELLGAVDATGADFASAGGEREKPGGEVVPRLLDEPFEVRDRTADYWRIAWRFMPSHPSSTLVRRVLFDKVGGFREEMRAGEDWPLWAALWLNGRFTFVNRPLFRWQQLASGVTAGKRRPYRHELRTVRLLGTLLLRAVARRRPGTAWFAAWYLRMVVRRQFGWVAARVRPPRRAAAVNGSS